MERYRRSRIFGGLTWFATGALITACWLSGVLTAKAGVPTEMVLAAKAIPIGLAVAGLWMIYSGVRKP